MSRFVGVLFGVIVGFVLAHFVSQTPQGGQFFARLRATLGTFVKGFSDTIR